MPSLLLPSRFTQQPQQVAPIDRGNALSNGLAHCWALNVLGTRQLLDSAGTANGSFGAGTGGTSGNSWQVGGNGYFIAYSDAGTGTVASVALAVGDSTGTGSPRSNIFSFAARIQLAPLSGISAAIYGSQEAGGIEIRVTPSGQIELVKQQVAAMGTSTGTIQFGVDVDIGVSYDGVISRFFINGVAAGTASSSQTFLFTSQCYLGWAGTNERPANGSRIYRADVWNRALSASEMALWSQSPWQIFKAPPRRIWYGATAATSIAASLAWTEAGDSVSIISLLTNRASVAWLEADDTMALTGVVTNRAAIGWTEQGDTVSLIGAAQSPAASSYTAVIAWTEASETFSAQLRLTDRASLAYSEQNETWLLAATSALPPGSPYPQMNLYTIMRDSQINLSAQMGAPVNLTGILI